MIKNTIMFAEWLHNTYENLAEENGWRTQLKCQTEFNKLPDKNKKVMIQMACRIKKQFHMFFDKLIDNQIFIKGTLDREHQKLFPKAKKTQELVDKEELKKEIREALTL